MNDYRRSGPRRLFTLRQAGIAALAGFFLLFLRSRLPALLPTWVHDGFLIVGGVTAAGSLLAGAILAFVILFRRPGDPEWKTAKRWRTGTYVAGGLFALTLLFAGPLFKYLPFVVSGVAVIFFFWFFGAFIIRAHRDAVSRHIRPCAHCGRYARANLCEHCQWHHDEAQREEEWRQDIEDLERAQWEDDDYHRRQQEEQDPFS